MASFASTSTLSRATALNWLKSLGNISDVDTSLSFLADSYQAVIAPASVDPPPPFGRTELAGYFGMQKAILKGFQITPTEVLIEEKKEEGGKDRVVVVAKSEAKFCEEVTDEEADWAPQSEYIFILTMDTTGTKIERLFEFGDSINGKKLKGLFARAAENIAKKNNGN